MATQKKIKIGTWIDARRVRVVKNGRKHEIQIDKLVPVPKRKRKTAKAKPRKRATTKRKSATAKRRR